MDATHDLLFGQRVNLGRLVMALWADVALMMLVSVVWATTAFVRNQVIEMEEARVRSGENILSP